MNKLLKSHPLVVYPEMATKLKWVEASLLTQTHYWLCRSEHTFDNQKWIYNTAVEWQKQIPFASVKRLKLARQKLLKLGYLKRRCGPIRGSRRLVWYTINYDKFYTDFKSEEDTETAQKGTDLLQDWPEKDRSCNDQENRNGPKRADPDQKRPKKGRSCSFRNGPKRAETVTETAQKGPTTRDYTETTNLQRLHTETNIKKKIVKKENQPSKRDRQIAYERVISFWKEHFEIENLAETEIAKKNLQKLLLTVEPDSIIEVIKMVTPKQRSDNAWWFDLAWLTESPRNLQQVRLGKLAKMEKYNKMKVKVGTGHPVSVHDIELDSNASSRLRSAVTWGQRDEKFREEARREFPASDVAQWEADLKLVQQGVKI